MYKIQEKQNYPFLDHIVNNLRNNSADLGSIKTFQASREESFQQINKNYQSCNKHQDKKGEYYEVEHPWIKFCQNCALNLALCGKRIQKNLSSQQMFNKITLCDIINQLGSNIKKIQQNHFQSSFISSQLQRSRQGFITIIHSLDKYINNLTQIKAELQSQVQNILSNKIKTLFQTQSLMVSKKIELINLKMKIQCGFMEIVDEKRNNSYELSFNNNVEKIIQESKKLIKQSEQFRYDYDYRLELVKNVQVLDNLFGERIKHINSTKVLVKEQLENSLSLECNKFNDSYMNKSLSNIFRNIILPNDFKTSKTLADQSTIHDIGKTNHTTCENTVRHSGLITPAQLNENPLGELCQNKRNSRATLQLRTRGRSKSGQRKIEVNVREQKEKRLNKMN